MSQFSNNKVRVWAGTYKDLTSKNSTKVKGSQSLHKKIGQLSGHLPTAKRRKFQPKGKESVPNNEVQATGTAERALTNFCHPKIQDKKREVSPCNTKRDRWAGTYSLSIVGKSSRIQRSQISNNKIWAKGTAERALTLCKSSKDLAEKENHPNLKKEKQVSPRTAYHFHSFSKLAQRGLLTNQAVSNSFDSLG